MGNTNKTPSKPNDELAQTDGEDGDERLLHADDVAQAQFEQRYEIGSLLATQGKMGDLYSATVIRGAHEGAAVVAKKVAHEDDENEDFRRESEILRGE